ncbi:MAG: Rpn family recombination-promoting nuclease/putative transposase [candidate division KSB1 bacterium]|nr:Rpn family recombination-promoting nuclease/putative transposase [candidate division KSB1 bacterium]MDZ7368016.1 Rpn family recombination-promoting nuclease/putative transposase [candidate division KSB1 bacterium]MDZ7405639.1 Rpn family recombination-promoting nuclease/putative transposase [candidate division KSB1 bacterium]
MQFADPRTDFAFTLIFGNEKTKDVLISFLNAVLGLEGIHAISEVTILNPYQAPKISTLKRSFLDVKCRDNRGVEFVVEMQVQYAEGFEKRIQYNACKAYVGQIPTGIDYPKLNQIIAITIVDFVMFKEFEHYLSCHEFRETMTNNCYLNEIRHYFIELPKFKKTEAELETTIEKWCYFIKYAGRLEMIPEKLNEEPFRKAFEIASRANMTKEEWEEYDAAAVKMQDERGIAIAAEKKGWQQRNVELARSMRRKGLDMNLIAELTGLSLQAIENLTEESVAKQ